MSDKILVFYGSYRQDRQGVRLANFLVSAFAARGASPELIDARAVGLPMLDRMYKEYPQGEAPAAMEALARKIKAADAFVFVTGEYNWGVQPGLKNLTDHFLEEWFWRPAAIASYSGGRFSGVRAGAAWHGMLSEMGMVVISSALAVGTIDLAFDGAGQPVGEGGAAVTRAFRASQTTWPGGRRRPVPIALGPRLRTNRSLSVLHSLLRSPSAYRG